MRGIRCRRCKRWFGRHRTEWVGDGATDNVCALRADLARDGHVVLTATSAPAQVTPEEA